MNLDAYKTLADKAETSKREAVESIRHAPPQLLDKLLRYLQAQHLLELAACATLDDINKLRQSQGAAKAFTTIADLLQSGDVEQRRTRSRPEV